MREDSAAQAAWRRFLGWTFATLVEELRHPTVRVVADRGPFRLVAYKDADAFGYNIYDKRGSPILKVAGDVSSAMAGEARVAPATMRAMLTEISIYTNHIADWDLVSVRRDAARLFFHVRAPWGSEADIVVVESGACAQVSLRGPETGVYCPTKISALTRLHLVYSEWRRVDDFPVRLRQFAVGGRIYRGE